MVLTRRRSLQAVGTVALAGLAGCSAGGPFGPGESEREYTLHVDSIGVSPVDYALYEPDDGDLFGAPARAALDDVLPDGRHTTYGYRPLPSDAYVVDEGTYFQTKHVVTGRERMERQLVRVEQVPEERVPESSLLVDSLERPSARVLKILHGHAQTDGGTGSAELLRGDAYVLRRPAELESRLATGDLDGRVVTMTESGAWAYRVRVTRARIVETAYAALAVAVASSRDGFREVVFGSRIDAELAPADLPEDAREVLERAIARETYAERTPVSESFETVLGALGLGDTAVNGKLLWYDDGFYRYALYTHGGSG